MAIPETPQVTSSFKKKKGFQCAKLKIKHKGTENIFASNMNNTPVGFISFKFYTQFYDMLVYQ